MDDKDTKLENKEQEYNALFEDFLNSANDRTFTKTEVEKILEANMYKEIFSLEPRENKSFAKNIVVSSKGFIAKFLNRQFIASFVLSYLFYLGFLIGISYVFFNNDLNNKYSIFVIATAFTLIDKLIKPLVFIGDLIAFTFHKIGLLTLGIYTVVFFFLSNQLDLSSYVTFEKALLISVIVLLLMFIIDFIKHDSPIKTNFVDDDIDEGSENDEHN